MVRRILLCTALTLAVAACERRVEPAPKPAPAAAPAAPAVSSAATTVYACANGAAARASYPDAQTAIVDYQGRTYTLKATPAASGARYVGEGLQWWTQGPVNAAVAPLGVGGTMAKGGVVACTAQGQGPSADAPLAPPAPGQPGGLPDDRTPVSEAPFTPESPQGAANVVQTYYALVEAGKYADAWKLWGDGGKASGQSPAEFAAGFGKFKEYHANVGAPGVTEGAAGSVYVEVPVVIYGRLKTGATVNQSGSARLRRANNVPGSTAEQRQWRIAAIELKASPAK